MKHFIKKHIYFKYFLFIFFLLLILFIIYIYYIFKFKYLKNNSNINEYTEIISEKDESIYESTTINLSFTGDIMCHNTIYYDAYNSHTKTYDFSYIFDDIKCYFENADLTIGNLETTFAGNIRNYSSYPTFNTPESLAYNLKNIGFDILTTANNHCYDSGYKGIESTINFLNDANILHTGTYKSEEEQKNILVKNVNGINIAFLNFTYGTNGITIPRDKSYSVNLISDDLILKQLNLAKSKNPDLLCVSMHWGIEYQTKQNEEQERLTKLLFENGADIIIGNHPHVLQPMEKRILTLNDGTTKDCFVIYSLGNLLADQNKPYTRNSAILNLKLTKTSQNKINLNSATYIPIYIYKDSSKKNKKFKLIDLETVLSNPNTDYNDNVYNTFKTEYNNIKKILGNEIYQIN